MPNISSYANKVDSKPVVSWLNDESQLAYIVPDGANRWKAVRAIGDERSLFGKWLYLWHVASGPLPLCQPKRVSGPDPMIEDPFNGWQEKEQGADKTLPWFGSAYPGVFLFSLHPTSRYIKYANNPTRQFADPGMRVLGRSDFGWVGRAYHPKAETISLWKRLERFMYSQGTPVDALGWKEPTLFDPTPEKIANNYNYIALPGALQEMRAGTPWYPYPELP
jgi:hypothetical protein